MGACSREVEGQLGHGLRGQYGMVVRHEAQAKTRLRLLCWVLAHLPPPLLHVTMRGEERREMCSSPVV